MPLLPHVLQSCQVQHFGTWWTLTYKALIILAQKAVEVLPGDTPETLQRRVMEQAEWLLLPQETEKLARRLEGSEMA